VVLEKLLIPLTTLVGAVGAYFMVQPKEIMLLAAELVVVVAVAQEMVPQQMVVLT